MHPKPPLLARRRILGAVDRPGDASDALAVLLSCGHPETVAATLLVLEDLLKQPESTLQTALMWVQKGRKGA